MRRFDDELEELRASDLLRAIRVCPEGVANFSSNDYLGLAGHLALKAAAVDAVGKYGTGSGASRLVCGTLEIHRELEEALALLKGKPACVTFSSGYATAVGTLSGLLSSGDEVILDRLCHASLIDGARLSGARVRRFPHNDLGRLEEILKKVRTKVSGEARVMVVTEAVFSMDGDVAPLEDMARVCSEQGALFLVDEAHATGTRGPGGAGLVAELGLTEQVPLVMGTLSKALGGSGGFLCAEAAVVEVLVNRARSFIYSTAPPPAVAAAALAAVELSGTGEGAALRKRLWENVARFAPEAPSPIVPVVVGESAVALQRAQELLEAGFLVPAIRYPTVPRGTARLRVVVSASHSEVEVEALRDRLAHDE